MNRDQRLLSQKYHRAVRLNQTALLLERAMDKAGVPSSAKETFVNWTIGALWDTFKSERKKQKEMIEENLRNLQLRFPNGTVNKAYKAEFTLPIDQISGIELLGAKELGLSFSIDEKGRCLLSGIPTRSGDFVVSLRYVALNGEEPSQLELPIAFNPDPRSLWKNIPTDENIVFYKPDYECEYIKVEADPGKPVRKDIVAASQRGRSHAQEGKARDDHYSIYHCNESDWYIMAVADGAGSAQFSRKGSEEACNAVIDHCRKLLLDNPEFENAIKEYEADRNNKDKQTRVTQCVINVVYNGAVRAYDAVKKVATDTPDARLKDFATTLMFAVCKKFDFGWFISSFWVGDGAICLFDAENKIVKLLGTPDEGEFSGQTRFVTMSEVFRDPDALHKRVRMTIVPDFTALFLMTDGVSDPMFETEQNLRDFNKWEEFYNTLLSGFPADDIPGVKLIDDNMESQYQLLRWLDFWSPGNHDDRTLAILY